ncbi:MAG: hypothetical protein J5533_00710 [Bacteroidales bacterium]|nr:hypothetical protein [Bacteroidales bacterium]
MALVTTKHLVFRANHPFIFILSEKTTGAILFAGKYTGN